MAIERRYVECDELRVERRGDEPPRIVGHAAVFGQLSEDLGGFREQVAAGAFTEALEKDDIRALWNHNPDHPLGRNRAGTLTLAEDARGLAITIIPPDTQMARDVMVSMERGDVTQMSFGFEIRPNGQDWAKNDDGIWIRTIKKVRLWEVSPVVFPAYPQTDVAVRELRAVIERAGGAPPPEANDGWAEIARRRLALLD